jgi:SWI/SNF chromatin-remodeling complex subunit SWI1
MPQATSRGSLTSTSLPNIAAGTNSTTNAPTRPAVPTRRIIEYVPLNREVDTSGGRDLNSYSDGHERRPLRDINEWGNVDIESLMMSIRSRLSFELSYALTTFTLLSTMKGQTPGSGFPISQCVDLLDETLDLLVDKAFDGVEETSSIPVADDCQPITHRELVNTFCEGEGHHFAALAPRQGTKDPDLGPLQRPGNVVLMIMNILRNLSIIQDNVPFISQHERLLDLMLRVCGVARDGHKLSAVSLVLSLGDVITARKIVLHTLLNLASAIQFPHSSTSSPPSNRVTRVARRAFTLLASYLVDPAECVSPLVHIQQSGLLSSGHLRAPYLPDLALDVFTRLSLSDSNRQVFSRLIPQAAIFGLFEALVHRLPVQDADFQLATREVWLSYLEKLILAMYSLAFLAPPKLKNRIKTDHKLAFSKVMLRMVQRFLTNPSPEGRAWFSVCARRVIETMKVIDDGVDAFDTSQTVTLPIISFGMGYGEVGDSEKEKGTGILAGRRDETWDLLMIRELDDQMFSELESLVRVDY